MVFQDRPKRQKFFPGPGFTSRLEDDTVDPTLTPVKVGPSGG